MAVGVFSTEAAVTIESCIAMGIRPPSNAVASESTIALICAAVGAVPKGVT